MIKYKLAIAFVAATLASCTSSGIRIGYGKAGHIAKNMTIPGLGIDGDCYIYAQELCKRLRDAGYEAYIVGFTYETQTPHFDKLPGHAFVVYRDTDGEGYRWYAKDNQNWMPVLLPEKSVMEMSQRFAGIENFVTSARIVK